MGLAEHLLCKPLVTLEHGPAKQLKAGTSDRDPDVEGPRPVGGEQVVDCTVDDCFESEVIGQRREPRG